jgi:peptidoglycan/LPS O-acetylase OafA/YrhL
MRRFLRIFPVYYGTLFVLFIAAGGFEPVRQMLPPSGDWFFYWAYLSNWSMLLKDANPSGVGHFWSLAVEEQFYLVWPLLVWKLDRKKLWVLVTILCCAAPLWRVLVTQLSWNPEWIYRNTLSRMDALLMGAAGAILSSAGAASRLRQLPKVFIGAIVAFFALLAAIRTVHYWQAGMQVIGYSLLALIFTGLVLSVSPTPIQSAHLTTLFRNPALRRVGKYSYGMYVFHIPVQILCKPYLERLTAMHLGILAVLVLFAITFAIAALSYELFESRILALKGRFEPKYAKPAAVAAR